MTPPPPPARRTAAAAALFALAAAAYARTVGFDFVGHDDNEYVYQNPQVLAGLSRGGAAWAVTTCHFMNWHPVTWISYQLDATVWGVNPAGYHLTNLLLHAANTALLFLVFVRATGAAGRSAAVAALWAVHPLHAESVAWVSERKDLLCGLFWLLGMRVYLWHAAAPGRGRMLAVAGVFALALASKPMAVTFPFALLVFDAWPLGRLRHPAELVPLASEKAYLFLLSAGGCLATLYAQSAGGALQATDGFHPRQLGNAAWAYAVYLRKTAWPSDLCAYYDPPAADRPGWEVPAAFALLAGVTAACLWLWRAAPYLLAGWLWFLGTLVPVVGLVQVGDQPYSDRYTYLPHVGLFAAAVWGAADLAARAGVGPRVLGAAAAGLVAGGFALTVRQAESWRDSRALWTQCVLADPGNATGWTRLAAYHFTRQEWDEAVRCAAEAVRLQPGDESGVMTYGWAVRMRDKAAGRRAE